MESRAARKYFSRVRRCLVCPVVSRDQFLFRGRELLTLFDQENPNAQYPDFVSAFGSPGDFAWEMQSCLDSEAVKVIQRRRRCIKQIMLTGLILVLLAATIFGFAKLSRAQKVINGDFRVVIHAPQEITDEECYARFEDAGIPLLIDGG